MPSIVKRAETDRKRMILGFVGIYAIAGAQIAFAVPRLLRARAAYEAAAPAVVVIVTIAIVITGHVAMRGALREDGSTPLALLDALERRHAGRMRMMRWMPWLTAVCTLGTIGAVAAAMIGVGRFHASLAAATAVTCLGTIAFVWFVIRRTGAKIERELREAREARRLLTEEEGSR